MIVLKDFQQEVVDKLLSFTAPDNGKNHLIINAPTGSGKTIMLLSWISEYIQSTNDNIAFVWFTPGAGELEEQSKDKAANFDSFLSQNIDQAMLKGFPKGSATFINWERVVGKTNKAMLELSEKENLVDKVRQAKDKGTNFILIIDEAHRNQTEKAAKVISLFEAEKIVEVSATIADPEVKEIEYYLVPEEAAISSGLLVEQIVVNEDVDGELDGSDEFTMLLDLAEKKRVEICTDYKKLEINFNPLVIIQIPDDSSNILLNKIEDYLEKKHKKTYENGLLGVWLSEKKENNITVSEPKDPVQYLIIKQAIATGWDAPRAKILVKIRENMGENFTIQTIGRIRRTLEQKHYGSEIADSAYLYTLDEKFLDGVFSNLSGVKKYSVSLKKEFSDFSLISHKLIDGTQVLNERRLRESAYQGFVSLYKLGTDLHRNKQILENRGFIIGETIDSNFLQGKFSTYEDTKYLKEKQISIPASFNENRIDILHALHELDRVMHIPLRTVEAIMRTFFMGKAPKVHNILDLTPNEWTAFMINNWRRLREDFKKIDIDVATQGELLINFKEEEFKFPLEETYTYNPNQNNGNIIESNVYNGYLEASISTRPSLVERLFERYLEENKDKIDFVYKNGDKGPQYFSVVYPTSIDSASHFYPDYIIQLKNKEIWIIETKGGQTSSGQDKNIDKYYSELKFNSLSKYAKDHNLNFGFVRDSDEKLYIVNSVWSDDMKDDTVYKNLSDEIFRNID